MTVATTSLVDKDTPHAAVRRRVRVGVEGTVQGVGFRPFVYRLASSLELGGFVRNEARGVAIEIEGARAAVERFLTRLATDAPRAAHVARVHVDELAPSVASPPRRPHFAVEASEGGGAGTRSVSIPPDLGTCDDCIRELFDPRDRRFRYPFINCTGCGPRFTITRSIPYDRAATTMASFAMCDECRREYDDPDDRRFHAQPNACPVCGPRATLRRADRTLVHGDREVDAVRAAALELRDGAIVAVKGLGGYHLACRADDDAAVKRLRARKRRDAKPFAVMVPDFAFARRLVDLDRHELRLLTSPARPIVLARALGDSSISSLVAPRRRELGVFLPYTPLHHLLLADCAAPLVMTSGNHSDEPIAFRDDDAFDRLASIADFFLTHDRPIETRCEDSVVRVANVGGLRQPLFVRRSRGFVPESIPLPIPAAQATLAVGGQLKNTACLVRDEHAMLGPHNGDLGEPAAFAAFAAGVEQLERFSDVKPVIAAYDLHPDYQSTRYAIERTELATLGVQHHHAHFAACLAEHGELGPAVGVVFDGTGYGTDGTIWGGELLFGDLESFTRVGHLRAVRMPGGDAAAREPWRMACAWLSDARDDGLAPPLCSHLRGVVDASAWAHVATIARSTSAPLTTSVGRLLDACAAMCGIARSTYEGQAAIELEAIARPGFVEQYPITITDDDGTLVIDPRPLVRAIERDAAGGRDVAEISACVHHGLVYATTLGAQLAAERAGSSTIVLSGGVFQNVLILESVSAALTTRGFHVLVPRRLPPNDGGLSYGQAAVAAWRGRSDVPGDSRSAR